VPSTGRCGLAGFHPQRHLRVMPPPPASRTVRSTAAAPGRPAGAREVLATQPAMRYQIRVEGVLDPGWSAWFDGMEVAGDARGQTTITGPVADQAALHGLLTKVRDLGLPLVSVHRVQPG
jgi:hypothetical protein